MPESLARATFRQHLCMAAAQDERIVGLLMLGSGSYEPVGFPSTFWTIHHAEPFSLRVEYIPRPESQLATILSLTASPRSVEAMVCCDKTGSHIKNSVEQLVGRSLRLPASEEQPTFQDRWIPSGMGCSMPTTSSNEVSSGMRVWHFISLCWIV
jgi:hypothetical protein